MLLGLTKPPLQPPHGGRLKKQVYSYPLPLGRGIKGEGRKTCHNSFPNPD